MRNCCQTDCYDTATLLFVSSQRSPFQPTVHINHQNIHLTRTDATETRCSAVLSAE